MRLLERALASVRAQLTEPAPILWASAEHRRQATRAGGLLLMGGSVVAMVEVFSPPVSPAWLDALAVGGFFVGLVLASGRVPSKRRWAPFFWVLVLQAALAVAFVGNDNVNDNARAFFIWMVPYVAFFFGRRATVLLIAWVALLLGTALLIVGGPPWTLILDWVATLGLMTTVAVFVLWATSVLRTSEYRAQERAGRDPLTGLGNRARWQEAVSQTAVDAEREGGRVVVALVDLDDFKGINDTFGHPAGDQLLVQLAPRLVDSVRSGDTVVRLGGDEFAVVCHDRHGDLDADELAERLLKAVGGAFVLPTGEQVFTAASVGVVVAAAPISAQELLRDADVAMYEAKAAGRNRWVRFDESMVAAATERHELLSAARQALHAGQCRVLFQPVYASDSLELIGAEALLRWRHPVLGDVTPDRLISVAESAGLIGEFTDFVLGRALTTLATWRATRRIDDRFTVSVNVSGRDLREGFATKVLAALARAQVPAGQLVLELTETALMDREAAREELVTLRAMGVWVLLDDFGSGFSSLASLEQLPLDGIKIDRGFLPTDDAPRRWEVVGAILEMARALGLHVIGEGVETAEQARMLHALGCRWVQGFLYSAAVPPEDLGKVAPTAPALGPFDPRLARQMADSPLERNRRPVPSLGQDGRVDLLPVR